MRSNKKMWIAFFCAHSNSGLEIGEQLWLTFIFEEVKVHPVIAILNLHMDQKVNGLPNGSKIPWAALKNANLHRKQNCQKKGNLRLVGS